MDQFKIVAVCNEYCGNDMKKLVQICFPILRKIGGISESDYDHFYSIANYEVWKAAEIFDESQNDNFDAFLRGCLARKFKTEMTRRNRQKKIPAKYIDSLDRPVSDDSELTFGSTIKSPFELEEEIYDLSKESSIDAYLQSLSETQKKIALMVIEGYELHEIKKILQISDTKFQLLLNKMKGIDKRRILINN